MSGVAKNFYELKPRDLISLGINGKKAEVIGSVPVETPDGVEYLLTVSVPEKTMFEVEEPEPVDKKQQKKEGQ